MERLETALGGRKFGAARFGLPAFGLVVGIIALPAIALAVAGPNLAGLLGTVLGWALLWLALNDAVTTCWPGTRCWSVITAA